MPRNFYAIEVITIGALLLTLALTSGCQKTEQAPKPAEAPAPMSESVTSGDVVDFLLAKLGDRPDLAVETMEALIEHAEKNNGRFRDSEINYVKQFLTKRNINLQCATATLLGTIGSDYAITELYKYFMDSPQDDLSKNGKFGVWAEMPLSFWIIGSIGKGNSQLSVKYLVGIASDTRNSDSSASYALWTLKLSKYRSKRVMYSKQLIERAKALSSHYDKKIAKFALEFLGDL